MLGRAEATEFRALAARTNYLAADQLDINVAAKEIPACGELGQVEKAQ